MEDKHKNFESFVRGEVGKFSGGPSDALWDNIAGRLDADDAVASPAPTDTPASTGIWNRWTASILGILLLLLLGLGFYSFTAYQDIQTLQNTLDQQTIANAKLQQNIAHLTETCANAKNIASINTNNQASSKTTAQNESITNNNRTSTTTAKNESITNNRPSTKQGSIQATNTPSNRGLTPSQTHYKGGDFTSNKRPIIVKQSSIASNLDKNANNSFNEANTHTTSNKSVAPHSNKYSQEENTDNLINTTLKVNATVTTTSNKWVPLQAISHELGWELMPYFQRNRQSKKVEHFKRFMFGVTAQPYATFTDLGFHQLGGFNVGLEAEYLLYKSFWLYGQARFNFHEYQVLVDEQTNLQALESYPQLKNTQNLKGILGRSYVFDFPLGLKWKYQLSRNNRFFVSGALSWQLYLPQKFTYAFDDLSTKEYTEPTYFLYLGSSHLGMGLEKKINSKLYYQVGISFENSFIPLGIEQRKITNWGFRHTLLF